MDQNVKKDKFQSVCAKHCTSRFFRQLVFLQRIKDEVDSNSVPLALVLSFDQTNDAGEL